jgi:hypothetical protein
MESEHIAKQLINNTPPPPPPPVKVRTKMYVIELMLLLLPWRESDFVPKFIFLCRYHQNMSSGGAGRWVGVVGHGVF